MFYLFFSILLSFSPTSLAQEAGFQFKNGYCQKNRVPGYNPNFKGECGMFTGSRLINEHISDKKMTAINLNGSFTYRSHFNKVDLNHAAYRRGYITESNFQEVQSSFVDFRGSWLKGNVWKDSDLHNWLASGSRIEKTSFINCNLQNANFWGTNLQESQFIDSDLRGANLESTLILFTTFTGSKFNSKTKLPFSKAEALKRGMVEID